MAKCYTFFFHLLTYEKKLEQMSFLWHIWQKREKWGLECRTSSDFWGNICPQVRVIDTESTYKKCLGEEWGKFTGYQLLSSFWLKVTRTDEDGNTTRWDRGTLPIRNLYPKWWMLRFGRIRKVTNWNLRLWFIVSY